LGAEECPQGLNQQWVRLKKNSEIQVGWSMGCDVPLSYVGLIPAKRNPEIVSVSSQWTKQLQQDRQKEADVVRAMYKKPQDYIQRVKDTLEVPTGTAVALMYNMISVTDFSDLSNAFARTNRPKVFACEPALQPNAEILKASLGDKVRLERFDDHGHALLVSV
jgi:hypothetical protein